MPPRICVLGTLLPFGCDLKKRAAPPATTDVSRATFIVLFPHLAGPHVNLIAFALDRMRPPATSVATMRVAATAGTAQAVATTRMVATLVAGGRIRSRAKAMRFTWGPARCGKSTMKVARETSVVAGGAARFLRSQPNGRRVPRTQIRGGIPTGPKGWQLPTG